MVRARDLGIRFEGISGIHNSITDVKGVEVGHSTIIRGEGELVVGQGPVRTGVTAVFTRGKQPEEVFGAFYSYNGNGEMTGSHWIEESGRISSPICITNTHSVGIVRDAVVEWKLSQSNNKNLFQWYLPIVAETYDGVLNDINGFHITKEHLFEAINNATSPNTEEGNVGGGTGMICHQFKGGIGTSSRVCKIKGEEYIVGILVQANYGMRENLTIAGVPVGGELTELPLEINKGGAETGQGSIIVIIATDAPLLPYQLKRLCKRVPAGLARVGGYGFNSSGDIFLAFSTSNYFVENEESKRSVDTLDDNLINPLFKSVAEATEEAIINTMIAARDMIGINNNTVHSLPHNKLIEILKKHRINISNVNPK